MAKVRTDFRMDEEVLKKLDYMVGVINEERLKDVQQSRKAWPGVNIPDPKKMTRTAFIQYLIELQYTAYVPQEN